MQSYDVIWKPVYQILSENFSDTVFNLWFSSGKLIGVSDHCVVLLFNSDMKADIIHKRYTNMIEKAFETVMGFPVDVVILSDEKTPVDCEEIQNKLNQNIAIPSFSFSAEPLSASAPSQKTEKEKYSDLFAQPPHRETEEDPLSAQTFPEQGNVIHPDDSSLNTPSQNSALSKDGNWNDYSTSSVPITMEYTFENFIVGNSNKLAYAACYAVANELATAYNPLFIHGPSGIGKTHLLYAIRNHVKEKTPSLNIVFVKGEEFAIQLINAIHNNSTAQFREKYRTADILLIDDIHFIAGKASTQEEFFNTFNALYEDQKQLIFTSDRPPSEIKTLEDRIRTRFEWGMIADIQPPDYELRIAILKRKAQIMHIDISMDILVFLADKLKGNIRQIEGAIKRLGAYKNLTHEEITLEKTKDILSDIMTGPMPENVKIEKILSSVAKKYGISVDDLKGKKRSREIAMARHIAIYIIRTIVEKSYPDIGKIFNRDHSTVLASYDLIANKMKEDVILESEVNDLIKEISVL